MKNIKKFKIKKEIETKNLYRTFEVDYEQFANDFDEEKDFNLNIIDLIDKTRKLFEKNQLSTDWKVIEKVEPAQLINSLAMICPFTISEKQRLLETSNLIERNEVLNQIINFYILSNTEENRNIH